MFNFPLDFKKIDAELQSARAKRSQQRKRTQDARLRTWNQKLRTNTEFGTQENSGLRTQDLERKRRTQESGLETQYLFNRNSRKATVTITHE